MSDLNGNGSNGDAGFKKLSMVQWLDRIRGVSSLSEPPTDLYEGSDEALDQTEAAERIPPHDLNAEAACLSALLAQDAGLDKVQDLEPSHFFSDVYARIFQAIQDVHTSGWPIDTVTVASRLHDIGRLAQVGGIDHLTELLGGAYYRRSTRAYADIVIERARERKLLHACQLATARIYARQGGANEIVSTLRIEIEDAEDTGDDSFQWLSTDEIFEPLPPTDWLVPGLHLCPGRPTLITGYGSSGKTLIAQAMALALAACVPIWTKFSPAEAMLVRHADYEQASQATKDRYQRLALGMSLGRQALGDRLRVAILPKIYLDDPRAPALFERACGDGTKLLIGDSFRAMTPTMDENDSAIRKNLDNLTRISEKTRTAFLVLHHAGKLEPEDKRHAPRGSSGIFDAAGCVFHIDDRAEGLKEVTQIKPPAEARGGKLPPFFLRIEDIEINGDPVAGVRVVYQEPRQVRRELGECKNLDKLKDEILEVIRSNPGLRSRNAICERVKGRRPAKFVAITELLESGHLVETDTGEFCLHELSSVPGTDGNQFPVVPSSKRELVPGSPPLRGNQFSGTTPHTPLGNQSGNQSTVESDASKLVPLPKEEWPIVQSSEGWSDARFRRAKGLARAMIGKIAQDALTLSGQRAQGTDPAAWATEQGWTDERIAAAIARMSAKDEVQSSS